MDTNGPRSDDSEGAPRGPEREGDVEPGDPSVAPPLLPRASGRGVVAGGPARPRTICVIEDDQGVSEALAGVLSEEGYAVMTAANGAEALARLRDVPAPALIVLDLMMPVMDGYAFRAEQLRTPAIADIPVVVLTAGAAPRAAELGPVDILKKPVDLVALLDAVGRYV
ncbi:response regulator [Sorangium sp. So ce1014]|uniref:response regulator n=1 Tax=Sorangium sp. So ce1014 TaxID=3133326 RepID=UPI003F61DE95